MKGVTEQNFMHCVEAGQIKKQATEVPLSVVLMYLFPRHL